MKQGLNIQPVFGRESRKQLLCILWSEVLSESPRSSDRADDEVWGVKGQGESIAEEDWRALSEWVGQEPRRTALPALWDLLDAALPLTPATRQLNVVRQDLAQLEAEALNHRARVAFNKLAAFLDMAIEHANACEGDPRRRSRTNFKWHGGD